MSNTNFNLYKIFCVVAETESFSKASDILCLTEPTISSHITKLENNLGVKLFYRENKGTTLTKVGRELYNSVHNEIKEIVLTYIVEEKSDDEAKKTQENLKKQFTNADNWMSFTYCYFIFGKVHN